MQLHELKPIHKFKKEKRIGRGGKHGHSSGRGTKGQAARAGHRFKPAIRDLIKRYPKLRGYRFKAAREKLEIVNVRSLEKKFKAGDLISPKILLEMRLIRKIKGKLPKVKILGKGRITKALNIEDCQVSKSAKTKIEKAGGKIK